MLIEHTIEYFSKPQHRLHLKCKRIEMKERNKFNKINANLCHNNTMNCVHYLT